MSETEVQRIISNYNQSLAHFSNQIEELTRSNARLQEKYNNELVRNRKIESELNETQIELDKAYN
jgi:peptidoglycan hydrolase CwlO-like protein